jgi:hypothetical protein
VARRDSSVEAEGLKRMKKTGGDRRLRVVSTGSPYCRVRFAYS